MIIGLTGYAQTGKDTVAKSLKLRGGFYRIAFADKLKELAYRMDLEYFHDDTVYYLSDRVDLHGWDVAKQHPPVREHLQRLGVSVRDTMGDDSWIRATFATLIGHMEAGHNVVFTDVRFLNECEFVKSQGGVIVRVTRPNVTAVNNHISDMGIDNLPVDHVISNDKSKNELGNKVTDLLRKLGV